MTAADFDEFRAATASCRGKDPMTDVAVSEGADPDIVGKLLNPEMVFVGVLEFDRSDDAGTVLSYDLVDEADELDAGLSVVIRSHSGGPYSGGEAVDHTALTRLRGRRVRLWLEVLPDA
jgi:hypothetical protein